MLFIFFFISLLEPIEALIFSLNISKIAGGVHGHQAIVSLFTQITVYCTRATLRDSELRARVVTPPSIVRPSLYQM